MDTTPYRLCCGQQHWSVTCPDGLVMCCICFERVPSADVWEDDEGTRWDMCRECGREQDRGRD